MGRLLPFLQLAVAACVVAFFGIWGSMPVGLAAAPLLVVTLCPLLAACAVWPLETIRRAFTDGWGNDPLRRARPQSVAVWRFMEGIAPISGALGAGLFVILALTDLPAGPGDPAMQARRGVALAGLCAAEAAGAFLLFRAVRQTVDLLQERDGGTIPREITESAVSRFSLSPREREVAGLLTEGLRYHEIASRLFISTKTVKTHVHRLYEKTGSRNRMELANRLRV